MDRPPSRMRRLMLVAGPASLLAACRPKEEPVIVIKYPPPPTPPLTPSAPPPDWLLTPGAPPPEWSLLDPWQDQVTRGQFEHLLNDVLAENGAWFPHIEITDESASIRTSTPRADAPRYVLRFARPNTVRTNASATARYWRRLDELPPLRDPARPLQDVHIALDPGHLGGVWAEMEERAVQPGDPPPVKEGDITLRTAQILAPMLEALGARISFVRTRPAPLTDLRPAQLLHDARASLEQDGKPTDDLAIRKESERLFYRTHEIRARAALINEHLRPDLVLHLHFNAEGSGGFSTANHLHVLTHGTINTAEFRLDDQRLDGLLRLAQDIPNTEIPLCTAVAKRMAEATGLPAFTYHTGARMVPDQPYVWMRNLLANRTYRCPVVYTEPYVMNNAEVIERVRAGDYEGTANVAGQDRLSIFREYAGGVAAGLRDYFAARKA